MKNNLSNTTIKQKALHYKSCDTNGGYLALNSRLNIALSKIRNLFKQKALNSIFAVLTASLLFFTTTVQAECRFHYEIEVDKIHGDRIIHSEFRCDIARAINLNEIPDGAIEIITVPENNTNSTQEETTKPDSITDYILNFSS
ncbi:hypothetical protein N9850_10380 [Granulosicoccus sp.]|nr:hypothetical protein [Granulosicoccus sp.]MDB4224167.1 hypothetical protein [Granulosicoccus sp.]